MLHFSRLKIFLISAFCLLSFYFAIPSFLPQDVKIPFLPEKKVSLGLDLKGGSHLLLKVDFEYYLRERLSGIREDIRKEFREQLIRTVPTISGEKIIFSLSQEDQKDRAKKAIRKLSSDLKIEENNDRFEVSFNDQATVLMRQNLIRQSIEIISRRVDENGTKEPIIQAQGDSRILLQVPGVDNPEEIKSILGKTAKMTFHFVADDIFSNDFTVDPTVTRMSDSQGNPYLIRNEVILNGDLLVDANPTYHQGQPAVAFRFNSAGTKKFAEITKNNIGRIFAVVLDGQVITAPRINTVISEGNGVISGSFTTQEAAEVALLLRAGALPAPLQILEERVVGPSLGIDSIKSGTIASVSGLIMITIFMVLIYGFFGLIANFALLVNVAITISCLALLGATLTLPGIAGIVLTFGMAIDANVLIYERVKEELREKKNVYLALEQGFSQAFRTIFDSNFSTLIVAMFLYIFGSGSVKGFAVTLSIGITASMFSAILLVRMIIAIWVKKTKPKTLNLI